MYRRAVRMEQEKRDNENFVARLGNLPVVNSAWTQACSIYQKTKERNALLRATCNLAEGGVQTVVTTTMPYMEKYQPQIQKVNSYACEKLAMMEEHYPVITRPTDELWEEGKEKCSFVIQPVTGSIGVVRNGYNGIVNKGQETIEATKGCVENVKDYGMMQVNRTLETPVAKFALEKVNEALTVSEEYVEKYLPPSDEELSEKAPLEVDEVSTFTRVTSLSSKLRRRMYKRALGDLKGLQMRSKEKLESLTFTVDLIQYAKVGAADMKDTLEEKYEVAQAKVVKYWEEINADEDSDDEEETPQTMERKTLLLARRLTRQMKQGISTVSGYMPVHLQPKMVRERLQYAIRYSEELYLSFKLAQGFEDLPSWLLSQAKEKMSYIQETVSFLTDTFLLAPISWLVKHPGEPAVIEGGPQVEEIEMEPLHSEGHSGKMEE